jgi:hypothetical protein
MLYPAAHGHLDDSRWRLSRAWRTAKAEKDLEGYESLFTWLPTADKKEENGNKSRR